MDAALEMLETRLLPVVGGGGDDSPERMRGAEFSPKTLSAETVTCHRTHDNSAVDGYAVYFD